MLIYKNVRLLSYSNHQINNLGKCTLTCSVKDKTKKENIEFQVVEGVGTAILGLDACKRLELLKRINEIQTTDILNSFADVFQGVGCLNTTYETKIEVNAVPVVYNARKIPVSIKSELKEEL